MQLVYIDGNRTIGRHTSLRSVKSRSAL